MMNHFERVLLYTVAVVLAGMLLIDRPHAEEPPAAKPLAAGRSAVEPPAATVGTAAGHPLDTTAPSPVARDIEPAADRPPIDAAAGHRRSLVLNDTQGNPRIELKVTDGGEARIELKSESGATVVSLAAGSKDTGTIALTRGRHSARLSSREDGSLTLEMSDQADRLVRMALSADGACEFVTRNQSGGGETVMRSLSDGTAEIAVREQKSGRGPELALRQSGVASVGIATTDGEPGPMMRVFPDGLAEIAIHGQTADSGPGMIRQPNGVSVIAVRDAAGKPRASMVTSGDGASVIAATSADGKQQASLRISAEGEAGVAITEPEKKPEKGKQEARPAKEAVLSIDPFGE